MKIQELKEKEKAELEKLLAEKKEKARELRFSISSKQIKNNRELRNTKKEIARILTLINKAK
jgi:large subunit ribosomal protein L29